MPNLQRIVRRYLLRRLTAKHTKLSLDLNADLPTLWYENDKGTKFTPPLDDPFHPLPDGFVYQHSRFPTSLIHNCLRLITEEDVAACPHAETVVDHGLIAGLEGRICRDCGGSQTKNVGAPWPAEWHSGGSRNLFSGTSTYPEDLVLAMVRPSPGEIATASERGHQIYPVKFERAVLLAATSCERCLNVLLWRHGLDDGYEEGSPDWSKANTKCDLCR